MVLPLLISGPGQRLAKQLERTEVMAQIEAFIEEHHPRYRRSALRRLLSGDLTDGKPPITVPGLYKRNVDRMLDALDVIETMAAERDFIEDLKDAEATTPLLVPPGCSKPHVVLSGPITGLKDPDGLVEKVRGA